MGVQRHPQKGKNDTETVPRSIRVPSSVENCFRHNFSIDFTIRNSLRIECDRARIHVRRFRRSCYRRTCRQRVSLDKTRVASDVRKKQARTKILQTQPKNHRKQLRKATRKSLFDEAVSEPISVPESTQNQSKMVPRSPRSASSGDFWRSRALDRPSRAAKVDSGGLGRAKSVDPGSIVPPDRARRFALGIGKVGQFE